MTLGSSLRWRDSRQGLRLTSSTEHTEVGTLQLTRLGAQADVI